MRTSLPRRLALGIATLSVVFMPLAAAAVTDIVPPELKAALREVYAKRPDLQKAFGEDGVPTVATKARGIASLDEWAQRYGAKELPEQLGAYAALKLPGVKLTPAALTVRSAALVPLRSTKRAFNFGTLTAQKVLVIDDATRQVLLSRGADAKWPLASISKVMTADVALENGFDLAGIGTISAEDEVGGARLRVSPGVPLTARDIFDSMLVGSANNCANAVARMTGMEKRDFVAAMNEKAEAYGMNDTTFVDPTGIEVENVSTAADIAALAFNALDKPEIRRSTTTPEFTVRAADETHVVRTTDYLLRDPYNGLTVLGGKTGYLNESGWNFVVRMKDRRDRPIMVVVLGARTQKRSFIDAQRAANWVWANYKWVKPKT